MRELIHAVSLFVVMAGTLTGCAMWNGTFIENNRTTLEDFGTHRMKNMPTLENPTVTAHLGDAFLYSDGQAYVPFPNNPNPHFHFRLSKRLLMNHLNQLITKKGLRIPLATKEGKVRGDYFFIRQVRDIHFNESNQFLELDLEGMVKLKSYFARPTFRINTLKVQVRPGIIAVDMFYNRNVLGLPMKFKRRALALTLKAVVSELDIDGTAPALDHGLLFIANRQLEKKLNRPVSIDIFCPSIKKNMRHRRLCSDTKLEADSLSADSKKALNEAFQSHFGGITHSFYPMPKKLIGIRKRNMLARFHISKKALGVDISTP